MGTHNRDNWAPIIGTVIGTPIFLNLFFFLLRALNSGQNKDPIAYCDVDLFCPVSRLKQPVNRDTFGKIVVPINSLFVSLNGYGSNCNTQNECERNYNNTEVTFSPPLGSGHINLFYCPIELTRHDAKKYTFAPTLCFWLIRRNYVYFHQTIFHRRHDIIRVASYNRRKCYSCEVVQEQRGMIGGEFAKIVFGRQKYLKK